MFPLIAILTFAFFGAPTAVLAGASSPSWGERFLQLLAELAAIGSFFIAIFQFASERRGAPQEEHGPSGAPNRPTCWLARRAELC